MTRTRRGPVRRCEIRVVPVTSGAGATWPLLATRDPWAGVAVAQISPDSNTEHEVVRDLLEGLGKNPDVTGWFRSVDQDRAVLPVWLAAHPIAHLVVIDAQELPDGQLETVAAACAVAGTILWLCEEEPGDAYTAMREAWPTIPSTIEELLAAVPDPTIGIPPPAADYPDVPLDGYVTFLAACRDRLEDDDLAVVTERFDQTVSATRDWAGTAGTLTEEKVITWLRHQLDGCRGLPEMLTVVRGVQVAAFGLRPDGYHVHVDLLRLLATADHPPEAVATDAATWRALAAYRDPIRGAACALAAAGAGMDDITGTRLDDVGADGTAVTATDGTTCDVHPDAAVYLRAQRHARLADGANGDDLLFADEDGPMRARLLIGYVRAPVTDLGIALTTRVLTGTRPDSGRWASRWGVSVQRL